MRLRTAALVCSLLAAGCGSRSALQVPRSDGGVATPCDAGAVTPQTEPDAAACTGSGPPPSDQQSPATGSVVGPGFTAVLCPALGAHTNIDTQPSSSVSDPALFQLDSLGSVATGAQNGSLLVSVGLPALRPGEYDSADVGACGILNFMYRLPVPCLSCGGVDHPRGPGDCPPGCSSACSHFGCLPCEPDLPSVSYSAGDSSACIGDAGSTFGSWHISLTSVTPPHGTFTATLLLDNTDASPDTVALSATF